MTSGGIAKAPRWQLAIAVVAALSLFTAVTTGWALRGSTLAQIAGPLPAAWQATHAAAPSSSRARFAIRARLPSDFASSLSQ